MRQVSQIIFTKLDLKQNLTNIHNTLGAFEPIERLNSQRTQLPLSRDNHMTFWV